MTHILLDIKYNQTESVLYDKNRGESIIINWCEFNNHSLVMQPITYVFPLKYQQNKGVFQSSVANCQHGYTSVGLLKESHISIHTYPEYNSIQIDFFSCNELNKRQNIEYMERIFKKSEAAIFEWRFIDRAIRHDS